MIIIFNCFFYGCFSQILFTSNENQSYIIATHKNCVNIWDLNESYACIWSKNISITTLIKHPLDNSLVISLNDDCDENNESLRKFNGKLNLSIVFLSIFLFILNIFFKLF